MQEIFNYEGNNVTFKTDNGVTMINATEMSKKFGKQPSDWTRLASCEKFLNALVRHRGIPRPQLVVVVNDGNSNGTWMHEDVAIEFSRWLSPAFAIWCNDRIKELLTRGQVSLKPKSRVDLLLENVLALKEHEDRIKKVEERVNEMAAQQITRPDYFAVAGYAALKQIPIDVKIAATLGRKASSLCKIKNIHVGKISDPRFGVVNVYPSYILHDIFESHFLSTK